MRFQGLAVVLGKKRWPQLIAHERKKDFGLDAYAPPSQTPEGVGKGLAASITPTLTKISFDAQTAKTKFPELKQLLFVTAGKVGNADRIKWGNELQQKHGLELLIIGREEIITLLMMPEHADLGPRFLHLDVDSETQLADVIDRTRGAAVAVTRAWARRTRGQPLVDLAAVRLDPNGAESSDELSLEQIDQLLSQSRRIVLEGPAGRGKTTTLVQLAQRPRDAGTPLLVDFPAWTSSRLGILDHIAGMPAFLAAGLAAADLARVQQTEPLLFLLNGWNEIAESNSANASAALRELERYFPSAGIIVATRTHHLTPPLPGALRLRLLRLHRAQREAYLVARLGDQGAALRTSCIPSFCRASDHAEDLSIHPLFHQHAPERLHQRTNPILGPIGKMVVQHQPLPKQRMRPPFHRVRLQPPVIANPLARRTQQRQHSNRQRAEQQQAVPPIRARHMHR